MKAAVFLSGGGRTLRNLIAHRDAGDLDLDIALVIASRAGVGGLTIAGDAGIPTRVVRQSDHTDAADYQAAMFGPCRDAGVDLVIMAGFLKHVLIPDDFSRRVINIHPSLLPAFGGPGMYGDRVHAAAITRGVKYSGCTVHFVDNIYDNGPIIHQRICGVLPGDTPATLAARVFAEECRALPEAITMLASTCRPSHIHRD